jgi:hypothetical protein
MEIDSELSDLELRKSELEREKENLGAAIVKLRPLTGQPDDPNDLSQLGITDAIRQVLRIVHTRMSAAEVKDALDKRGFPISRYNNPMASIYKILNRLAERKEILCSVEGFNVFYQGRRRTSGKRNFGRLASPDKSSAKEAGNEPQPTTNENKTD